MPAIRPIPAHSYGSPYYYNLGCRCASCLDGVRMSQAAFRRQRRAERIIVNGHKFHPKAPHGTSYGRSGYGCACPDCRATRRRPGSIISWAGLAIGAIPLAQAVQWAVLAVIAVALAVWIGARINPVHLVATLPGRAAGLAAAAATLGAGMFTRRRGKHRARGRFRLPAAS